MTLVISHCVGANAMQRLAEAGFSSSEIARRTIVPQTLAHVFALTESSRHFVLLDEIATDVSIRDLSESSRALAEAVSHLLSRQSNIDVRPSQQTHMAAGEALLSSLAAARVDRTPHPTYVTCRMSSTVGRGMAHSSRIARAIFADADWDIRELQCGTVETPSIRAIARRAVRYGLDRAFVSRGSSVPTLAVASGAALISGGSDGAEQRKLLERHRQQLGVTLSLKLPAESVVDSDPLVAYAMYALRNLNDEDLRACLNGAQQLTKLSSAACRALAEDVMIHHLRITAAVEGMAARLERALAKSDRVFVGRGTPFLRALAEDLGCRRRSVFSVPHGLVETNLTAASGIAGNVYLLPYRPENADYPAPARSTPIVDDLFAASSDAAWAVRSSGTLMVMNDVPFGGSWPTWAWGLAEFGSALGAVRTSLLKAREPAFLREKPSDPKGLGALVAKRYGIDVHMTERQPADFARLVGISSSSSLLVEAAFHGRRSICAWGRGASILEPTTPGIAGHLVSASIGNELETQLASPAQLGADTSELSHRELQAVVGKFGPHRRLSEVLAE